MTGTGKSYYVVNDIIPKCKNALILDIYAEDKYKDFETVEIGNYTGGIRKISCEGKNMDLLFDKFINYVYDLKNTCIVIEDCSLFLNSNVDSSFKTLLIKKRHKNINYVLLFHSLNQIPPFVFELSNYLVLSKTNDTPQKIWAKFGREDLNQLYETVKASSNSYERQVLKII